MTATATIDLAAIERNVARVVSRVSPASVCAVVKANGYGHGAVAVAEAARAGGASWLAVATPAEAAELAPVASAFDVAVLLLPEPDPDALATAWPHLPATLRLTVASAAGLDRLEALVGTDRPPVPVHLMVDTGMHRMGAEPGEIVALAGRIADHPLLHLEGLSTHFAVADDPDDDFTAVQTERFASARQTLEFAGHRAEIHHLCNSGGVLTQPDAHAEMVRLGIAMYGVSPSPAVADRLELDPALALTATVTAVRTVAPGEGVSYGRRFRADEPTRVATVDIGYADGIRRDAGLLGVEALVRGTRSPIIGVVTMDQTMLAVGPDVEVGDEVVLIGRRGTEVVTAEEVAERLGTIGYEVLTSIGPRVRRVLRS
ncbi:MAG: alanine racemase [Ilumatobacteraceae bacterium]